MTGVRTVTHDRWREVTAFGLLTALGAAVVVSSFSYDILLEGNRVGPGFLPLVTGFLLLLLSGAQLIARLRASGPEPAAGSPLPGAAELLSHAEHPEVAEVDAQGRTEAYRVRQLWTVVAAILVAIPLVSLGGFLITFGLLVLFITLVVERRPWPTALAIALAAVGVVYGVFGVFLNVPLPHGLLDLVIGS